MYVIEAETIICNYFGETESVELKLSDLSEIKNKIEKRFNEKGVWLFVDTTFESISNAVQGNPKYFSFNESRSSILFNESRLQDFYVDLLGLFNNKPDGNIRYDFLNELELILENYE